MTLAVLGIRFRLDSGNGVGSIGDVGSLEDDDVVSDSVVEY